MTDANNFPASEIENQVALNRDQSKEQVKGQVLFGTQQLMAPQAETIRYLIIYPQKEPGITGLKVSLRMVKPVTLL